MSTAYLKILTIILIFMGEVLAIYSEIAAARNYSFKEHPFASAFFKILPIIVLASTLLLIGYMLGLKSFKNIWVVSAISITSILIMEPIIAYTVTNQLPTRGAIAGLIFGVLGFMSALFL